MFNPTDVAKKRADMNQEMMQYYYRYSDQMDEMDRVMMHNSLQQDLKKLGVAFEAALSPPAPLPPILFDATVGLGKSNGISAIVDLALAQGLKVVIVVPTHALANEYCERIPHAYHYYGRQSKQQAAAKPALEKFICWQKTDANRAAAKNHLPAQSICRVCPHAYAHVLENVVDDAERVAEANTYFKSRNMQPADYPPCRFLYDGLPEALSAAVVVITPDSFSDAMGFYQVKDGTKVINKMQRLVIVDEKINLTKEIEITTGAIDGWLHSLDALTKHLTETNKNPELLKLLPMVEVTFKDLIAANLNIHGIKKAEILELCDKIKAVNGMYGNTASWERIHYLADREFVIPLRALHTLAHNLEQGTVRQSKNKMHVYEVSQLLVWAIENGSTIFLDATTSLAMKILIAQVKGEYFDAHVAQNMHITRFSGHMYARGNTRLKNYQQKSKNRIEELKKIASTLTKPAAIVTHMAWLKNSMDHHLSDNAAKDAADLFFNETGVKLGWFGAHDRGHNEWEGHNIAIVGLPFLASESIQSIYSGDRAALMTVGVSWPAWDGNCSQPDWANGIPPLPNQPEVLNWLLDRYAATLAQAIGRTRAVNSNNRVITIQIYGGLQTSQMDAALFVHGVVVDETMKDEIHVTLAAYRNRGTDMAAINQVIERLQSAGKKLSRRGVRDALTLDGKSANDHVITARLSELRQAKLLPPAKRGRPPQEIGVRCQ